MKLKKWFAGLVAGAMLLSTTALSAFAVSPYPEKDASVSLEAFTLNGEEGGGSVEIVDSSDGFSKDGDFYRVQAVAQEGYQFAYWEVDLIFEMKDDTLVDMGDGYTYINENGYEIYAFSNPFESSLYSPTDSQLMINRVMPKEMEDISILHYSVKAYFVNEAEMDWIAVPVQYVYNGEVLSQTGMVEYLAEGTHMIAPDLEQISAYGFALADPDMEYTVTVLRDENGNLVASPADVKIEVVPTTDPADVSFTLVYVDAMGNPLFGGKGEQVFFDDIGRFSSDDLPLPYGYKMVVPAHPGEEYLYPTSLEYVDGQWKATVDTVYLMVEALAKVEVSYALEDGTVLEDASYEVYFDLGDSVLNGFAPDGYELVGETEAAIHVEYDLEGNLAADPSAVTFVVRAVDGGEAPEKGENPPTGTSAPLMALGLLGAAALAVGTLTLTRKKRKEA